MVPQRLPKVLLVGLLLSAAATLSACGSAPTRAPEARSEPYTRPAAQTQRPAATLGERAVSVALQQVGVPYQYGGQSPTAGFDCSGLVHYSYLRAGQSVPRTTGQLWDSTARVERSELRPGDLIFFSIDGKMQHVGMYIGRDQFVHAPSSGKQVTVASLSNSYYQRAYLRGGRLR